ncbi:Uncharacterized protein APZ42_029530 [Daphnia magna]|uniref:Uncharacterized protein n=1 Tax=Daphnia magna TaxID=35525 RepID=A0A164PN33_9CRUS|nr:Uncharacterized protein APZ42_029530 [Daphnia magna]
MCPCPSDRIKGSSGKKQIPYTESNFKFTPRLDTRFPEILDCFLFFPLYASSRLRNDLSLSIIIEPSSVGK